mmetsp:Transcript_30482/g.85334  ORF Transcript_30482/g.85334 Transcript_30482/m.85334 type:complete len:236 (+) Transcript_30482:634-1341(+)
MESPGRSLSTLSKSQQKFTLSDFGDGTALAEQTATLEDEPEERNEWDMEILRGRWEEDGKGTKNTLQQFWRRMFQCRVHETSVGGEDALIFSVYGESFLLHQIRKMIALSVAILAGHADHRLLEVSLKGPFGLFIPRAPGWSLLLADNDFMASPMERYQRTQIFPRGSHFGENVQVPPRMAGFVPPLDSRDAMQSFKEEMIYPHVIRLGRYGAGLPRSPRLASPRGTDTIYLRQG